MKSVRFLMSAVVTALAVSTPVRADDAAIGAKLDAIEKRLASIEQMEHLRGPKIPFALTFPTKELGDPAKACQMLGYAQSWSHPSPNVPDSTLLVCYGR